MIRMNITVPEDVVKELKKIRNKSRFITEILRERLALERKKTMDCLLQEGYKKSAREDHFLAKEWDVTAADGVD